MSLPEKEVLKTKICCSCEKEKTLNEFWRNRDTKSGYDGKCKYCRVKGYYCKKKPKKESGKPKNIEGPQLYNCSKQDWIETYEFLKNIGYDLSGEKTIHEQFCEKHNLTPRKRMREKSIQYSPKDLGLI